MRPISSLQNQAFSKNEADHMEKKKEKRKSSSGLFFEEVTNKILFFNKIN